MKRKIIQQIIIYNFILASFIILDLVLPGKENAIRELDSFYSFSATSGSSRKSVTDTKSMVELTNGERYRIGLTPDKDYNKGNKIIIIKSTLSNNINEIKILDKNWIKIRVGLFSNMTLLIIFIFSILVTLLNIFIKNKTLNVALIASMMFITIIFMIYNFYF